MKSFQVVKACVIKVVFVILFLSAMSSNASAQLEKFFRAIPNRLRIHQSHLSSNTSAIAFTPDSKELVIDFQQGRIAIVDVSSRETIKSVRCPEFLSQFAMSPTGDLLVGFREGFKDVFLWNPKDWEKSSKKLRIPGHAEASSMALSPDGKILAVGSTEGSIFLFDMPSQRVLHTLSDRKKSVTSLSFSPDGKSLASAAYYESSKATVTLWDVISGKRTKEIVTQSQFITCVKILPNGKLATSGREEELFLVMGTVKIWDIASNKLLLTLEGHKAHSVKAMVYLSGDKLITGGTDGTLRLWDLAKGRELHKIEIERDDSKTIGGGLFLTSLILSPDRKYLAAGFVTTTGRYKLWKLSELFPETVIHP